MPPPPQNLKKFECVLKKADENEYYYVSYAEEGAVPEETINGLPVRERQ